MTDSRPRSVVVYTFGPAWGMPVPTGSPFGLKLITWLRMHDVPHEVRIENNPGKGPKGKCPWVVIDGDAIADSQHVIEALASRTGVADALTSRQAAVATATRLMLEEHYHQVWEHELFIHEGGWKRGREFWDDLPPVVRTLVRHLARSQLRKQLWARGVGRHEHAQIVGMGKLVLDSIDELIGDGPFFFGDEPHDIDATVFSFMALTQWTPVESPLWDHYRARPRLLAYCQRVLERYYASPASPSGEPPREAPHIANAS
jgi:glutathione S-transferase